MLIIDRSDITWRTACKHIKWRELLRPADVTFDLLDESAAKLAAGRRSGVALALMIWSAFIVLDLVPPIDLNVLGFRAVGAAAIAIGLWLTMRPAFYTYRYSERVLFSFSFASYLTLSSIVARLDRPFSHVNDYPGLILTFFTVIGLFRLRARTTLLLALLCLPLSAVVFFSDTAVSLRWIHEPLSGAEPLTIIKSYYFYGPITYLAAAMLIGVAVSALLERDALQALLRQRELVASNAALAMAKRDSDTKTLALLAAKEELRLLAERESHGKSKFLADAAHDLSQPLHAVSLLAESVRHAVARGEVASLVSLVDDLCRGVQIARSSFRAVLEVSQLQTGSVKATICDLDVEKITSEAIEPFKVIAISKGVHIRVRLPASRRVFIRSDGALLARLLGNLISNAVKYSDPNKETMIVLVGIIPFSNRVRFDVIDNGIGIPESWWKRVFEPFERVSVSEGNREKGLGLGLSIVSAIVNVLPGHRLDMRSSPGYWTRFSLEAPRGRECMPSPGTNPQLQSSGMDFHDLYIWYIEDDEPTRLATAKYLMQLGVLLETASDLGELAQNISFSERRPDLVISDYRLPEGKTAIDVARIFRAKWGGGIPVLVISGNASPSSADDVGQPSTVLRKPTAPEDLISAIRSLCMAPSLLDL